MGQTTCCSKEQAGAAELVESGPPLVIAAPGLAKMGRDLALKLGAHAQGQGLNVMAKGFRVEIVNLKRPYAK